MSKSLKKSADIKSSNVSASKSSNKLDSRGAVSTYDFTSFDIDLVKTKELLNKYCKKWVFQLEQSPKTKKQHYQGRLSLKVKLRLSGAVSKFPKWHLSITSKENTKNDFYVTKEDSRVEGPWKDDDEEIYIPRQVREMSPLFKWEQKIIYDSHNFDTRTINIIYNPEGHIGKSTFCTYCGVHRIGRKIPYCNDFRDIMRIVMDTPTSNLYLFDMPRAIKKDQLYQFFSGVEEIKNGYAFDDRYKFREKYFDCPSIWIFTNKLPDLNLLSLDRWKIWEVIDFDLVPYSSETDNIDFLPDSVNEDYGITKKKNMKNK